MKYLRKTGWLTLYRSDAAFEAMKPQLEFGAQIGVAAQALDTDGRARAGAEPQSGVPPCAVLAGRRLALQSAVVTRAYAARFAGARRRVHQRRCALAASRRRHWRVDTNEGAVDADKVVVALGPWSPDVLEPLGIKLPLGIKRGYHRHFDAQGQRRR